MSSCRANFIDFSSFINLKCGQWSLWSCQCLHTDHSSSIISIDFFYNFALEWTTIKRADVWFTPFSLLLFWSKKHDSTICDSIRCHRISLPITKVTEIQITVQIKSTNHFFFNATFYLQNINTISYYMILVFSLSKFLFRGKERIQSEEKKSDERK